jgi:hypothetical protein
MKRFLLALLLALVPTVATAQLGVPPNTFIEGENIIDDLNENFTTAYSNALNRTTGVMTGTLTSQALIPASTNTYDLGTSLVKYRDLFLSRNLDVAGTFAVTGTISDPDTPVTIGDQMQITSTTSAQLQVRYDSSNYVETSVSSAGAVTINAVGASAGFSFSDPLSVSLAAITNITNNVIFTGTPRINNAGSHLVMSETDGSANSKIWRFDADGDSFRLRVVDDTETVIVNVFSIARSGTTVGDFNILASQTLLPAGSITTPALGFTANDKAGLYSTSGGIVLSAQDTAAGAGDDAGVFVTATTSGGEINLSTGNGVSSNTIYRLLSSRLDLTNGNPFIQLGRVAFASLPTPSDSGGGMIYCTDCTAAACSTPGTGALAVRKNGAWVCY